MPIRKNWQMKQFILSEICVRKQEAGRIRLQHHLAALTVSTSMQTDMKCCQ